MLDISGTTLNNLKVLHLRFFILYISMNSWKICITYSIWKLVKYKWICFDWSEDLYFNSEHL